MEKLHHSLLLKKFGLPYFKGLSTFGALSDEAIIQLLESGSIKKLSSGDILYKWGEETTGFNIVLEGDLAFYKHCTDFDVLTRHFVSGEEGSFDRLIGLFPHSGTAVATEETLVLEISHDQFFAFHLDHPADFGILMINLARELSREIDMLERLVGEIALLRRL